MNKTKLMNILNWLLISGVVHFCLVSIGRIGLGGGQWHDRVFGQYFNYMFHWWPVFIFSLVTTAVFLKYAPKQGKFLFWVIAIFAIIDIAATYVL